MKPEVPPPPHHNSCNPWLLYQLADSAFPTGGFAHSGGLEAAWQQGEVRGSGPLRAFLESSLTQLAHGALPFVVRAHAMPDQLGELDSLCDAFLTNHVANRASRLQGKSFLLAVERGLGFQFTPQEETPPTDQVFHGHWAPLFGAIAARLGISRIDAVRLFVFVTLRSWVSAAVRLGIVGPMEGQSIQLALAPFAVNVVTRS